MKHKTRKEAEEFIREKHNAPYFQGRGRTSASAFGQIRPIPQAFRDPIEFSYDGVDNYYKTRKQETVGEAKRKREAFHKALTAFPGWKASRGDWKSYFILFDPNGLEYLCLHDIFPFMVRWKKVHPRNPKVKKA
jgi:hypothetical protein